MKQTEIRLGTHGEDYGNWIPNLILYTVGGMFAFMAALTAFCFTAFYFPLTGTIFSVTATLLLALLLETLRVLKKGGVFALNDDMKPRMYGDMEEFAQELRDMGYEDVRLIDTDTEVFDSRRRAAMMMLDNKM